MTISDAGALKAGLPRTWGAFFGRYGAFTPTQLAAIPRVLAGDNVVVCAATASGKTEAALAPLIERHLPATMLGQELRVIYVLPTRALITDLASRLASPLERLRLRCAVKTRDLNNFSPKHPSALLLTTPESLDSLLAKDPKSLITVRAVVIDELHSFDGTARGDQLRALLNRLRIVRAHAYSVGDAPDGTLQYVALSATLGQPAAVAARYFPMPQVVQVAGARAIRAELIDASTPAMPSHDVGKVLGDVLRSFRVRGWAKALAFCNTRAEVELYAAATRRAGSPFGESVFTHYSNLDRERRAEVEAQFASADAALCFASSTLELGIDIGNIDGVLLIGAPGSAASFAQRIGRAGRRKNITRTICFYRTPLERLLFDALLTLTTRGNESDALTALAPFRPSVAIQQIFSLIKQSPTGSVRLRPLLEVLAGMVTARDLEAILGELQAQSYLVIGRPGEWRAGARLNRLIDAQAYEHTPLSLYSNIQADNAQTITIRDRVSQRPIARVDRQWLQRSNFTLEGRQVEVSWDDGAAVWVSNQGSTPAEDQPFFRSARQLLSFELAQQLPRELGLTPDTASLVETEDGWLCFHWLGDLYGHLMLDLLRYTLAVDPLDQTGVGLLLREQPRTLPVFTTEQVWDTIDDQLRQYEGLLALGAYQKLLPDDVRRRAVMAAVDIPRFVAVTGRLRLQLADTATAARLRALG